MLYTEGASFKPNTSNSSSGGGGGRRSRRSRNVLFHVLVLGTG